MTSFARVCVHRKYSEWKESSESQDLMPNGLQDFIKSTNIIQYYPILSRPLKQITLL